ncbi:MAG: hypothetical protein Q9209_005041 [Squamulea sp. 1 TL-2023]
MVKRKAPSRAAKKDPYDLNELLTSAKSKLIDIDLHGMLADFFGDPNNWSQVSNDDKEFIRGLLPLHVELTDDGSIPTDFWKYNPEFRLDCRNLREDLRAGRMDSEWQLQAHQAMEERATGAFDSFKEREYEEYWGQKQKVEWNYLAGDASKVKLDELLDAGLFKVGDIWSFDHTFGRRDKAVKVQKECKIMKIDGKAVTFAIPPGQLKFARRFDPPLEFRPDQENTQQLSDIPSRTADASDGDTTMQENSSIVETSRTGSEPTSLADRSKLLCNVDISEKDTQMEEGSTQPNVTGEDYSRPSAATTTGEIEEEPEIPAAPSTPDLASAMPAEANIGKAAQSPTSLTHTEPSTLTEQNYDAIYYTISTLWSLEKKIIQIDGRVNPDSRTASAWRDIRCLRNEQDLGSLFEMRDEYYAYKVAA